MARSIQAVAEDGFLREWLLLGAFAGEPPALLDARLVPEPAILPRPGQAAAGHTWFRFAASRFAVNLHEAAKSLGADGNCCVYAHVYLHAPQATPAVLALGSDDGAAAWVNGQRVFALDAKRAVLADEDRICVSLQGGWNRLLIKIQQYDGEWGFCARLLSASGVPLQGLAFSLDDPQPGKWPRALAPAPLAIVLTTGAKTADGAVTQAFTVLNLSARPTPAARLVLSDGGARPLASARVPTLPPGRKVGVQVRVTPAQWTRALATPLAVRIEAGKRPLSATGAIAPDAASAFHGLCAQPPAFLAPAARQALQRIADDLRGAPDLVSTLAPVDRLTRALLAKDGPATDAAIADLDAALARAATGVAGQAVYLVGHAHIDMNWLWRWPETVQVCQDSFRQALRFMNEFPEFCFSQSQASCYAAVEEHDPELFTRIRAAVHAGRWNVVGGMWTESDTNLSSGEALARSFLLAQRYFAEKLGVRARVGWLPDCFGHTAQLPQLLRSAGMESFYHMRTGPSGAQLYWWKGQDGSLVLAKTGQGYNGPVTPAVRAQPALLPPKIGAQMFVYGVGDHGGGPTRNDIESARAFAKSRLFPRMKFATADEYFADVRPRADRLPVHHGELQYIFEGCYTNVATIKQGNRDLENALQSAEAAAFAALQTGRRWPAAPLGEAWRTLVFNEFHDILPGSAIHESNDDSRARYFLANSTARDVQAHALRAVAERVCLPQEAGGIPVIVFNPLAWTRTDIVVAELVIHGPLDGVRVEDEAGREIAAQVVRAKQFDADVHVWVQFTAPGIPGLGYRTFRVHVAEGAGNLKVTHWGNPYPDLPALPLLDAPPAIRQALTRRGLTLRNRFLELTIDEAGGHIRSLRRRTAGRAGAELIGKAGANRLAIYMERPRGMSAWVLDPNPKGPLAVEPVGRARVIQEGPESISVRSDYAWGRSRFHLTTTVHADSPRIDCQLVADWLETGRPDTDGPMLRAEFALREKAASLACDVPFAVVDRPAGREVPAQKWVDVPLRDGGLALLNAGKYGHSLVDGVLRLSLLRSSYDPDIHPDLGRHGITWALLPHAGDWRNASLPRTGAGYNVPLVAYQGRAQKGDLPTRHSFLTAEGDPSFVITGVKQAEDGTEIVVRGYNASARAARFGLVFDRPVKHARRVTILEEPADTGHTRSSGRRISDRARPWEIVTLRVRLERG